MVAMKVREWLASEHLQKAARPAAHTYRLPRQDLADLHQELCLALLKVGLDQVVNGTWVFSTANHRAFELLKRERKRLKMAESIPEDLALPVSDPELSLLARARASRLPESLRLFYRLRYEEGFTQREIAQQKRLTRGSVRGMEKQCLRWMTGPRGLKLSGSSRNSLTQNPRNSDKSRGGIPVP
jgi:RNA polymerase sigma factor (sigma-70 family)